MKSSSKRGVILMNLGSPDSTEVRDVRKYLDEFLMDERVIDSPYILRSILVKGIITPFRSPKSAEAYSTIWTENGSPLVYITRQLKEALAPVMNEPIAVAMRYGNPDMKSAYEDILKQMPDVEEIILLPLYPHYAMSSFETASVHAQKVFKDEGYSFKIKIVRPFYNHPAYITALAESMRPYITDNANHLLFSYHSIPEGHIIKSDITRSHCFQSGDCCVKDSPAHDYCYRHQCLTTTKLVTEKLGISNERYSVAFQSKLGRAEWLKPATTMRMEQMPKEGNKNLTVVCPSFVSDCLETLEEIEVREKENFMNAGGESFTYIPCMNTRAAWVDAVVELINDEKGHLVVEPA